MAGKRDAFEPALKRHGGVFIRVVLSYTFARRKSTKSVVYGSEPSVCGCESIGNSSSVVCDDVYSVVSAFESIEARRSSSASNSLKSCRRSLPLSE